MRVSEHGPLCRFPAAGTETGSLILIKDKATLHAEKDAIYEAGLRSSPWQHIDETGARVNGQNQRCHIVCNPLYTVYFTTEKKDRPTVIDVLRNSSERSFLLNDEAFELLHSLRLSARVIGQLNCLPHDQELGESEFAGLLDQHLPNLGPQQRKWVLDATAIAAYHAQTGFPVVELLICDDAPQFKLVTDDGTPSQRWRPRRRSWASASSSTSMTAPPVPTRCPVSPT